MSVFLKLTRDYVFVRACVFACVRTCAYVCFVSTPCNDTHLIDDKTRWQRRLRSSAKSARINSEIQVFAIELL